MSLLRRILGWLAGPVAAFAGLLRAAATPTKGGAKLTSSDLTAANLAGANLEGADLDGANVSAANLRGADGLTPGDVEDVAWVGATCPNRFEVRDVADTCATAGRLDGCGD